MIFSLHEMFLNTEDVPSRWLEKQMLTLRAEKMMWSLCCREAAERTNCGNWVKTDRLWLSDTVFMSNVMEQFISSVHLVKSSIPTPVAPSSCLVPIFISTCWDDSVLMWSWWWWWWFLCNTHFLPEGARCFSHFSWTSSQSCWLLGQELMVLVVRCMLHGCGFVFSSRLSVKTETVGFVFLETCWWFN